jgi:hypothetical protein
MRTSLVRYVSPTPRHTSFRKERAIVGAARGRSASAIPDLELIHPGVRDLNRETPFGNSTRILSVVVAHLHCAESSYPAGDRFCVVGRLGAHDRIGDQALVRFGRGRLLDEDRFDPDIAGGVLTPIGRRRSPRGRSSYVAST